MKAQSISIIFCCALISACVSQYKEPASSQPSAVVKIKTNHSGVTASNVYLVCSDELCVPNKGSLQLAAFNWANPSDKTIRLESGKRIRIKAMAANYLTGVDTAGYNVAKISGNSCENVFSFTPLAGHTYEIQQKLNEAGCQIEVIDSASGNSPESLIK